MAMGELPVAARPVPAFFRQAPFKQFAVYVMPFPKGLPTAPELLAVLERDLRCLGVGAGRVRRRVGALRGADAREHLAGAPGLRSALGSSLERAAVPARGSSLPPVRRLMRRGHPSKAA